MGKYLLFYHALLKCSIYDFLPLYSACNVTVSQTQDGEGNTISSGID